MKYLALSLLLLAGCVKLGPNFKQPCVPVQDEWLECTDWRAECDAPDLAEWWHIFNDDKLNEVIGIAKAHNLDLKEACFRIIEARAELGIAIGRWFPQLQEAFGSAEYQLLSDNAPNTRFADLNYWDFLLGLRVAWELDFWGRFRRGVESANDEFQAAQADYDDTLVLLLADVASTYITIRTLEEQIQVIEDNVAIQNRSLEIVQARWQAGMVTELDVQQAKTLVFGTKARMPPLYTDLRIAKNAMALLLGTTPAQIECIMSEPGLIPETPPNVAIGIPAELLCQRPDVRRALNLAGAQSAKIGVAITDLFPRISLVGSIGFESSANNGLTKSGRDGPLISGKSLTYALGPQFVWPILNYGRLRNKVTVEKARFVQRVLQYQNTVLNAYSEVENGVAAFLNAHDEIGLRSDAVMAASRATELSRTQYVEGIADYTRVLNTEQARLAEDELLILSRGTVAQGLIATYRALGGGWQCRN